MSYLLPLDLKYRRLPQFRMYQPSSSSSSHMDSLRLHQLPSNPFHLTRRRVLPERRLGRLWTDINKDKVFRTV